MSNHIMKSSSTGAAFRYARVKAKTFNVPYVQLWTGVLVLLLSVMVIMHPLNVMGYGWFNVFPFALTLIVIMFTGLMPFWLVLAALVGAGYQGSNWNNPFGGAASAVDFWARKIVAGAITAYAFLGLPLIFIPMGNFPLAFYGYAIAVAVIFFAGLVYGKPMGFGYKVIVGMALAMIAIGGFLATPSSVKDWAHERVIGHTEAVIPSSGEIIAPATGWSTVLKVPLGKHVDFGNISQKDMIRAQYLAPATKKWRPYVIGTSPEMSALRFASRTGREETVEYSLSKR